MLKGDSANNAGKVSTAYIYFISAYSLSTCLLIALTNDATTIMLYSRK